MAPKSTYYMDDIDHIDVRTSRIEALRENFYNSPVHICAERSHLATLSWKET
ncbi:MAG: hypothetical protein JW932_12480 [Deltaproteobacteria bacterium]|nr:hypothetical protein [Deltaproteobacteria bacterium]